eukprot:s1487_g8.t1
MSICGSCVQPDPRRSSASRRPTLLPIITSGRTDASELEDIDHLNEQSLIDTDYTVSVEARSLPPSFKASQACEVKILATLAERGNDVLLRTKIAQAVISTAWIQFRLHTALDIFLQVWVVLALAICSFEVRYERTPYGWLIFLVVLHAKRPRAMSRIGDGRWKKVLAELFALDNVADLFFIIVGWFALIRRLALPLGIDAWMAAFCAWNWLKLLYSLRGELWKLGAAWAGRWIGPRLLPIFFALRESLGFFFVVFMAVAASSHAYYDLQLRREAAEVVLQIGRLGIWGDFDLYEFEGLDPWLETERDELGNVTGNLNPVDPSPSPDGVYIFAHLLFFVTGVGVTVLLMNLLIGILSTDFGLYEQKSTELFNRARAKMMKEGSQHFTPRSPALNVLSIVGASACVPMLLKFAVSPWRLVLGRESFELLVETPLVPFVRYSGGCGMVTILLVLLSPVIFVLSLAILIISLIPAAALRVTALRHLLNGGLGVRADDANQSAWFASQCGIVVFYGGDSDGYSGTRKAFEATRGALRETRTSVEESLIFIKAHVGVPLTKEEEDLLKSLRAKRALPRGLSLRQEAIERSLIYIKHHLGLDLKDDEERILKDILPDGRANSPPLPPPEHPPSDPRASGSDLEIFEKRQQERMNTMECRLNDLHRGLNEATDRLTWACQVLYKTSTQVEDLHRSHEHLVGFIEQRLVGYSGDGNQVRPGRGSFPTAQRRPSPSYQPDYSFQYPVEDGRAQGSPRNPNGAEVVTVLFAYLATFLVVAAVSCEALCFFDGANLLDLWLEALSAAGNVDVLNGFPFAFDGLPQQEALDAISMASDFADADRPVINWALSVAPVTRLGRLLGHHYAFVVTRWGFGKSMATILARAGSQKLALGAVATGATGLTIHHNTKERHFGSDVLSSEQEVEWLNAAIKPIWDHLDAGVRKIIEDEIRPALQQRLGRRLGSSAESAAAGSGDEAGTC